jgi:hypothetical protein
MECFYSDFHTSPPVTRWEDRHRARGNSSLASQPASQLSFSYTLIQPHTSIALPEPERHGFTSKIMVSKMSHWEVIRLPFCLLGQV